MKILYVDLQYDYGNKDRGINEIGTKGFRDVFLKLGHQVDCFFYDEYLQKQEGLQEALLEAVDHSKPDLVYFILFAEQFKLETIKKISEKYNTVNWFGDDQWRFDNFTRKYAPVFTHCITTDPFAVPKYREIGCRNVHLSQWAAMNADWPSDENFKYDFDVSFVGASNSVRRWFVKELKKKGIHIECFGFNWPNGPVPLSKMIDIFHKSKVSLNLSNSIPLDLRYLMNSYKNPIVALLEKKTASQIKARNFEIPYFGGFQMTDYVPTIEDYFNIGKEIVCYRDVDEAALLIKHYLKNDDLREKIKKQGIERARKEHTYFHRHEIFFKEFVPQKGLK